MKNFKLYDPYLRPSADKGFSSQIKDKTRTNLSVLLSFFLILLTSCEKFLDVDAPVSKIEKDNVFRDDITANTAVTGMYASMLVQNNFASGTQLSLTNLAGLSADELANYFSINTRQIQFFENNIQSTNEGILDLWTTMYQINYQANSILEGLDNSQGLSTNIKAQLQGEALFIRAFCHFSLVNLFGEVPLILTTSYEENTRARRTGIALVYDQIVSDLKKAKELMTDNYPSAERVRPNKAAAIAMLARVYLYLESWENAEIEASEIINNATYAMEEDLNNVFLSTSREAIWQLRQTSKTVNTWEGFYFILNSAPANSYLAPSLVESFENGDQRFTHWVGSKTAEDIQFFFPFKYKIRRGGPGSSTPVPLSEYSMVLRLAEQFLIRSEARAKQGNLIDAIADIDVLRARAGLNKISETNPSIDADNLLQLIGNERRVELFTEWGHRWFDLKRTGKAVEILSLIKSEFTKTDELYPIPSTEFLKNPFLGNQNPGY